MAHHGILLCSQVTMAIIALLVAPCAGTANVTGIEESAGNSAPKMRIVYVAVASAVGLATLVCAMVVVFKVSNAGVTDERRKMTGQKSDDSRGDLESPDSKIERQDITIQMRLDKMFPQCCTASAAAGTGERCAYCMLEFQEAEPCHQMGCGHCFHMSCATWMLEPWNPGCIACDAINKLHPQEQQPNQNDSTTAGAAAAGAASSGAAATGAAATGAAAKGEQQQEQHPQVPGASQSSMQSQDEQDFSC